VSRAVARAAAGRPEVVLVSDRGPVTAVPDGGRLSVRRRPGSLAATMHRCAGAQPADVRWVACTTVAADQRDWDDLAGVPGAPTGYRYRPVLFGAEEYRGYYDDAGARLLWPALHGTVGDVPAGLPPAPGPRCVADYLRVNRRLAEQVATGCSAGALVSFHDYQVAAAPAVLRRIRPGQRSVLFLHTPFPPPEQLAELPAGLRTALVSGMLGADLLGFQCRQWAARFLDCCESLGWPVHRPAGRVDVDGRSCWVRVYPVPIAAAEVRRLAASGAPAGDAGAPSGRVLVRVDRLDPSKNVLRGFAAFGLLLDRSPELRGSVHFDAYLVPSRTGVPEYRWYAAEVRSAVAALERRHPGSVTVHLGDDQARAFAALRRYDVLLVNAVSDGMNLVAQEGPLVNETAGVLVLSTATGSADLLGDAALRLDRPTDVTGTAVALDRALRMPAAERRRRAELLRHRVAAGDPVVWLQAQLDDLAAIAAAGEPASPPAAAAGPAGR